MKDFLFRVWLVFTGCCWALVLTRPLQVDLWHYIHG